MNPQEDMRHLSQQEFAHLGMADIAYVKRVVINDAPAFAMHAADGTPMAVVRDRDSAVAALLQHDLVAVSVH